jgi:hypothetical protein
MLRFRLKFLLLAALMAPMLFAPLSHGYVAYETHVLYDEAITQDIVKLLPRAMGLYVYENRYDFLRGMTFMARNIRASQYKRKDVEEIRREAYERCMRDIPFCVDALKGGELKLDTVPANVAGRLGMIAYSISIMKLPDFPDAEYLDNFIRDFEDAVVENAVDFWVFYDGYGDFKCLGELMERLKVRPMPTFTHVRNPKYASGMKEDMWAMFRPPDKFNRNMVATNVDINRVYNDIINDILDTFMFVWKCSGMDLAHPSYSAPPGTLVVRYKRGNYGFSGGVLSKPSLQATTDTPPQAGPIPFPPLPPGVAGQPSGEGQPSP